MDILQTPQRLVRVSIITSNIATLLRSYVNRKQTFDSHSKYRNLDLNLLAYSKSAKLIDSALDHIWQDSYDHNPRKLKKIERELVCCGFSSLDDRSVPKSSPFACRDSASYGYNIPCQVQLKQAYGKIEYSSFICLVGILVLQLLTLAALVLHWFQVPPEAEIEVQTQEEHNRSLLRDWDREDQDNGHNPAGETPQREGNNDYGSINNLADQ
ncbi:hypothetical protein BGZ76_002710 [Entomortierella beljakovae]|nr:hypothetical protein BGZ76_002710 [Entomortierella beljakovae]